MLLSFCPHPLEPHGNLMSRNTMFLRFFHVRTSNEPSTLCFTICRRDSVKGFMRSCRVSPICPTCPAFFRQLPNSSQSSRISKMAADNRLHSKKNPGGRTHRLTGKPFILHEETLDQLYNQKSSQICDHLNGDFNRDLSHSPLLSVILALYDGFTMQKTQFLHTTIIKQILAIFEFRKLSKIIFPRCRNRAEIPLDWSFF